MNYIPHAKLLAGRCGAFRISRSPTDNPTPAPNTNRCIGHLWKAVSEATSSKILPGLITDDSKLLLILLCFLADSDISVDLLYFGATPRKRWTEEGGIVEMGAHYIGLMPNLERLLSDRPRISNAFNELHGMAAIAKNANGGYVLDAATRARILGTLPSPNHRPWRQQALLLTYRSVPWKYLEPRYAFSFSIKKKDSVQFQWLCPRAYFS